MPVFRNPTRAGVANGNGFQGIGDQNRCPGIENGVKSGYDHCSWKIERISLVIRVSNRTEPGHSPQAVRVDFRDRSDPLRHRPMAPFHFVAILSLKSHNAHILRCALFLEFIRLTD